MYGPEVDNNFNTNKWVYLFYSPPEVKDVKFADGTLHDVTTPTNAAPNTAAALSAWDNYVGYFQLSRFKFVDAAPRRAGAPRLRERAADPAPDGDNRGACCHVAGDIDFDSKNNLWMVTGDDTPAGGGNSGGFGPFNGMLTNESQTIAVANATGGTFTLTFDGQTTAPIAFPLDNARDRGGPRGALEHRRRRGHGHGHADGQLPRATSPSGRAADDRGRVRPDERDDARPSTIATTAIGGLFNAPHVDARRGAQNTGDLRGKLLRIKVKDGDITPAEANSVRRRLHRPGREPLSRSARRGRGPRSTRWASGTRSGSRSTRTTSRT